MDAQQTYLLNGLLTRNFGLGRIVRFRQITRGRQADTFELFTTQEREYLVHLYPPAFSVDQLNFIANAVNMLDANRFSVMPFVKSHGGGFAAEGPQNAHLLVSLAPAGSSLAGPEFTLHDISQVGLRLAWMHRLLKEQLAEPPKQPSLASRFYDQCFARGPGGERPKPLQPDEPMARLHELLHLPVQLGWTHGDMQLPAMLHDGDHQLRCITDWGLLHFGSPLEDVVDAFFQLSPGREGLFDPARGRALLDAYDSLLPVKRIPWTPVVAAWCAQRVLDFSAQRRPLPDGFRDLLAAPERFATAMASCM